MPELPVVSETRPRFWAIVPAAGSGSRMAAAVPKQYLALGGSTVLEQTLNALFACESIEGVVLALAAGDPHWPGFKSRFADRNLECISGGAERSHSVLNALDHLAGYAAAEDWVLVHDAARPCLRVEDIDGLIRTLAEDPCGGLLGVPVSDTMKRLDPDCRITGTVDRERLWHAQTPQMFRLGMLRTALENAITQGMTVTDEASAMEHAGHRPRMVQGHTDNIKITVASDMALAEFYLRGRDQGAVGP